MPTRNSSYEAVKQAMINDDWVITDDAYVISYGDRFVSFNQQNDSNRINQHSQNKMITHSSCLKAQNRVE